MPIYFLVLRLRLGMPIYFLVARLRLGMPILRLSLTF
jgi:hypothetical protein